MMVSNDKLGDLSWNMIAQVCYLKTFMKRPSGVWGWLAVGYSCQSRDDAKTNVTQSQDFIFLSW